MADNQLGDLGERVSKIEANLESLSAQVDNFAKLVSQDIKGIHHSIQAQLKTPWQAIFAGLAVLVAFMVYLTQITNKSQNCENVHMQRQIDELKHAEADPSCFYPRYPYPKPRR